MDSPYYHTVNCNKFATETEESLFSEILVLNFSISQSCSFSSRTFNWSNKNIMGQNHWANYKFRK